MRFVQLWFAVKMGVKDMSNLADDSFCTQFDGHETPTQEPPKRTTASKMGQYANRSGLSKACAQDKPEHVAEAAQEQLDSLAFWLLASSFAGVLLIGSCLFWRSFGHLL